MYVRSSSGNIAMQTPREEAPAGGAEALRPMPSTAAARVAELERAFADFTATSLQLEDAYRELEQRAAKLGAALAQAQDERLAYLTEKEQLAGRLAGLLETLPAGVVVLDAEGLVLDCNPAATALLGEGLIATPWSAIVATRFAREAAGGEFALRDGRIVSLATRRIDDGRILVISDVTETRRLQGLLARNRRLSEIGQMNARLAHQLRTPLATAVLYASQLRAKTGGEREQRYAGKISDSLGRLERMVNDMLRFAGGEVAQHHGPVAINALFAEVAAQMEARLRDGVEIEFGASPGLEVMADREALAGALTNLVGNALEHARQVTLSARRDEEEVVLVVDDDGPGVPAAERERVFEPFYTTRANGTGLGLAVVASVARGHGGRADVGVSPAGGASFAIRLPVANTSAIDSGRNALAIAGAREGIA